MIVVMLATYDGKETVADFGGRGPIVSGCPTLGLGPVGSLGHCQQGPGALTYFIVSLVALHCLVRLVGVPAAAAGPAELLHLPHPQFEADLPGLDDT